MIEFKDFTTAHEGWFVARLSMEEVVEAMNAWLVEHPVDVVTVETILAGPRRTFEGIRVWYRVAR